MKYKAIIGLLLYVFAFQSLAQESKDYKIHSHNDYLHSVPFWTAYSNHSSSIEADVILQNGQLFVAHELESINPKHTLQSLYLDPIRNASNTGIGGKIDFILLIDLKTEAYSTLEKLEEILNDYQDILSTGDDSEGVRIVVSGNRPKPEDFKKYSEYVAFDFPTSDFDGDLPMDKIAMVSLHYKDFSGWNGKGRMVEEELNQIRTEIQKVHSVDKPIRFWGSPDSKTAWKAFYDLGIDYINTDHPFEANSYLKGLKSNVTSSSRRHEIYQPEFLSDTSGPLNNIILMIGDGNGLAHISAGMYAHEKELNLLQLKNIGLVKTHSADDFTTDSAAGATAYATGQKANNRAISVAPDGSILKSLPEILKKYHFNNGVVTTDRLTGATPSAFYAHRKDRDMVPEIASDLKNSSLDLFIGGGKSDFLNNTNDFISPLKEKGFTILNSLDQLDQIEAPKVGFFEGENDVPSILQGRGDYLAKATNGALSFLTKKNAPIFLMIEAAMIDTGGHWNSAGTVVEEEIDFDISIGEVLKYADMHPGTLVIITADHETGGVTIPQGNLQIGEVELNFETEDHTAIMVPVFAYGYKSEEFRGVYDNTEIFKKIIQLVEADRK